jgi:glyoxylase-like metal-dependent hydrolase (beta-lactamase superfamily II)
LPTLARADVANRTLDIYWVDVEGGAATLIVAPNGESILIDTGNPGVRDPDRIVNVAAKVAKLQKIDHLVTTHYHTDHFGGAAAVSKVLPIGTVHDNGEFDKGTERPSKEYLEFKCDKRSQIKVGEVWELKPLADQEKFPKLTVKCLAARQEIIGPPPNVRLARNPLMDEATALPGRHDGQVDLDVCLCCDVRYSVSGWSSLHTNRA